MEIHVASAPKEARAESGSSKLHSDVASHWQGENHPYAMPSSKDSSVGKVSLPGETAAILPKLGVDQAAPPSESAPAPSAEVAAPIQQAIEGGKPIQFSSSGENQAAGKQPDYFLTPEGKIVPNEKATPSPDGSINIELQSKKPEDNKSLREAITHQTEMQKQAAKEMIRLFQKAHPGQAIPGWMNDLANAKPNIPDFVPSNTSSSAPPPENGFANRGVSGGNSGGFAGNGGFDGGGNFRGNGGAGDGTIPTGGTDSKGQPIGPGEQVQAKQLYDYFVEKGFTPAQASGILGNLQTESSFKTNAYNHGEGAIGLAQWEGGRRTALEQFAKSEGKPVTDWHVQADFIMHELKGSESGAYAALKAAQTPAEAAAAFDKYYERSSGEARGQRQANATNIYHQLA